MGSIKNSYQVILIIGLIFFLAGIATHNPGTWALGLVIGVIGLFGMNKRIK
jgi:hypothetical protein